MLSLPIPHTFSTSPLAVFQHLEKGTGTDMHEMALRRILRGLPAPYQEAVLRTLASGKIEYERLNSYDGGVRLTIPDEYAPASNVKDSFTVG